MNLRKPIMVKRLTQSEVLPQRRSRLVQESDNVEQIQQIDLERPEQLELVI